MIRDLFCKKPKNVRIVAQPKRVHRGLALSGTCGKYRFEAEIDDYPFGAAKACVRYLRLYEKDSKVNIAHYDDGWNVKPEICD